MKCGQYRIMVQERSFLERDAESCADGWRQKMFLGLRSCRLKEVRRVYRRIIDIQLIDSFVEEKHGRIVYAESLSGVVQVGKQPE